MNIGRHTKQPREVKDYPIDYGDWLAEIDPADAILSMDVISIENAANPADTTLVSNRVDVGTEGGSVWLSGGTAGNTYKVTVMTTTAAGRKDEVEFTIIVKDY